MAQTKEISENLRKRVDVAHQARKAYKAISKEFGLHKSTVRQIVDKLKKFKTTVTLSRSGPPTKITLKARLVIVHKVAKDHRVTFKQLAFLTGADVNVHESTIRRTLNNHCMAELQEESHCSPKRRYICVSFIWFEFTLSTFRTCVKIWWCFGSYLCRNIENTKGFTNFQAALYSFQISIQFII